MSTLRRSTVAVVLGAAVIVAIVLLLGNRAGGSSLGRSGRGPLTSSISLPPQQGAMVSAQRAFVAGYLAYLDGAGTGGALPFASITAREQVARGGRVPAAFRDGPLRVTRVSGEQTSYSAQATITAANRSESYVLTVQLLLTQHGWRVAQLAGPDLAMDDSTRPVIGPAVPAAAQRASGAFAIAYAVYRTTSSAAIPGPMTATARQQLLQEQDSLASMKRGAVRPRLLGLRFGPLDGTEFAVTATVQAAKARRSFTVLMVNRSGRWECDAFL